MAERERMRIEPTIRLREAGVGDAEAVAALHAWNWRTAYRGIFPDHYLDEEVDAERLAHWRARLGEPSAAERVLLAESEEGLAGFVCTVADAEPPWGLLVDNLHVAQSAQGMGLGVRLLESAAALADMRGTGMFLFVYAANASARVFYARRGGAEVERFEVFLTGTATTETIRVAWTADQCALGLASIG